MIKIEQLTPDIYYNQSRDFQFIGRLFDVVMNAAKTNTDLVKSLPLCKNTDTQLLTLASLTLGFKSKHNYNIAQLNALCNVFCYALKNKGNIQSIVSACNALLNAEGIKIKTTYKLTDNNTNLTLRLPTNLYDITLLRDLLDYILPAGMSCTLIAESAIQVNNVNTVSETKDTTTAVLKYADEYNEYAKLQPPESIRFIDNGVSTNKGFISNSTIYKQIITGDNNNEND